MVSRHILSLFSLLLSVPVIVQAQTVTTLPLAKSAFCIGESMKVDYTVTGTFDNGNIFRVQLSDPAGSFQMGFRNLESVVSVSSGSIIVQIPTDLPEGNQYRFRVIASKPAANGSDNGTDITLSKAPSPSIELTNLVPGKSSRFIMMGTPLTVEGTAGPNATYEWSFGPDASPSASNKQNPPPISFATPGLKTITLKAVNAGGCSGTTTAEVNVVSTTISISSNVVIVRADTVIGSLGENGIDVWICPGGSLNIHDHSINRIFVERGGSIDYINGVPWVYLKDGASYNATDASTGAVLYEAGAGIITGNFSYLTTVQVPSLVFDYSNVPANGCPSLAPYTVQIKPNVNSIHAAQNDERSNIEYWVWGKGDLTSAGDGNTYYVEAGGSATIRGSKNRVYLKDGGTLNVASGEDNRIFYETQGKIENAGYDAVLLPSSGITFEHDWISGIDEAAAVAGANLMTITPNPVGDEGELRLDGSMGRIDRVRIYNDAGVEVGELKGGEGAIRISLKGYAAGVYYVKVETEKGELSGRIVKQ